MDGVVPVLAGDLVDVVIDAADGRFVRPVNATDAPSLANISTMPAPIPAVPPVTSATFPRSLMFAVSFLRAIVQLAGTVKPALSTSGVVPKTDEASSRTSPLRTLSGRKLRASTATT
jgi:hypothetical protein